MFWHKEISRELFAESPSQSIPDVVFSIRQPLVSRLNDKDQERFSASAEASWIGIFVFVQDPQITQIGADYFKQD